MEFLKHYRVVFAIAKADSKFSPLAAALDRIGTPENTNLYIFSRKLNKPTLSHDGNFISEERIWTRIFCFISQDTILRNFILKYDGKENRKMRQSWRVFISEPFFLVSLNYGAENLISVFLNAIAGCQWIRGEEEVEGNFAITRVSGVPRCHLFLRFFNLFLL